jgi:hypothetical protein
LPDLVTYLVRLDGGPLPGFTYSFSKRCCMAHHPSLFFKWLNSFVL